MLKQRKGEGGGGGGGGGGRLFGVVIAFGLCQGVFSMRYQIEHSPCVDGIKRMSNHFVCRLMG